MCLNSQFIFFGSYSSSSTAGSNVLTTAAPTVRYGGSFLLEAVQSFQQEEKAAGSPRDELRQYLDSGVEPTSDVILWWGVCSFFFIVILKCLTFYLFSQHPSMSKYPTLQPIARDYLAIQGSATPSERAFSGGGITGSSRRASLAAEMFEALQILKSAYRNGHIAPVYQAAEHLDAVINRLDDDDEA